MYTVNNKSLVIFLKCIVFYNFLKFLISIILIIHKLWKLIFFFSVFPQLSSSYEEYVKYIELFGENSNIFVNIMQIIGNLLLLKLKIGNFPTNVPLQSIFVIRIKNAFNTYVIIMKIEEH